MIIVYAGQEGSEVTDPQHGKPIMVSTTARILFRAANPDYKKVKNVILNKMVAELFAKAATEERNFTPKNSPNSLGEFRNLGSMRFIAIVEPSAIKVISVKGAIGRLPSAPKTSSLKITAGFEDFMCNHMSEFAKRRFKLSDNAFARLQAYLMPMYDNKVKMLKSICRPQNYAEISRLLAEKVLDDDYKTLEMENHGIKDSFNTGV